MVSPPDPAQLSRPGTSSPQAGPFISGGSPAPLPGAIETDGLVLEREAGNPRLGIRCNFHFREFEKGKHK